MASACSSSPSSLSAPSSDVIHLRKEHPIAVLDATPAPLTGIGPLARRRTHPPQRRSGNRQRATAMAPSPSEIDVAPTSTTRRTPRCRGRHPRRGTRPALRYDRGSTGVEVALSADAGDTMLTLRHTLLPAGIADEPHAGWGHFLPLLCTAIEGAAS